MRVQVLLVAMGGSFVLATALFRLILAGLLANLLVGVGIWLAATVLLVGGLMVCTRLMIGEPARDDAPVVHAFPTEKAAPVAIVARRAA